MKYIITWLTFIYQSAPCPDSHKISRIMAGGVQQTVFLGCSVAHFEQVKSRNERTFYNKDSATAFYDSLKREQDKSMLFPKIDSVLIKKVK